MAVIAKLQKGKCVLSVVCYDCSLKKNPADRADLQSLVVRRWHLSRVSAWVAVSCFSCCFVLVVSWLVLSFVGLSILNKLRFINMFYVFGWKTSCKKKKKKKKKKFACALFSACIRIIIIIMIVIVMMIIIMIILIVMLYWSLSAAFFLSSIFT